MNDGRIDDPLAYNFVQDYRCALRRLGQAVLDQLDLTDATIVDWLRREPKAAAESLATIKEAQEGIS